MALTAISDDYHLRIHKFCVSRQERYLSYIRFVELLQELYECMFAFARYHVIMVFKIVFIDHQGTSSLISLVVVHEMHLVIQIPSGSYLAGVSTALNVNICWT